MHAVGRAS